MSEISRNLIHAANRQRRGVYDSNGLIDVCLKVFIRFLFSFNRDTGIHLVCASDNLPQNSSVTVCTTKEIGEEPGFIENPGWKVMPYFADT